MLAFLLASQSKEPPVMSPAIFRFPAKEFQARWLDLDESGFDSVCVDGGETEEIKQVLPPALQQWKPSQIDTAANMAWRNATISFVKGKISPKSWVEKTKNIKATVKFLSSPKTKWLRDEVGPETGFSVFATVFLTCQPGRICLTSGDSWYGRRLPEAGRLQSWVLAIHDFLGPALYQRAEMKVAEKPALKVIRADAKPGILSFVVETGPESWTFYFNNSSKIMPIKNLDPEFVGLDRGLIVEEGGMKLHPQGFVVEIFVKQ